ncbi:UbiA family prenyltransferase [Amycolatopsis samaneae]|uniref:2-isopropylmalate synthase n=1 Tax=Amycolatopsis samaneae TaxID=664691 RepID=A0ABW5GP71_9PSEU
MPRALSAHVETWRPYTLGYVGLVGLSGAVLVPGDHPVWRLCCAWLVPTLGWLAGLYGGDYFDRALDAIAKPHRPIPSGRMAPRTALGAMIGCALVGGVLGVLLNWRTPLLVCAAWALGIAYSKWFKGRGLAGNLVRGGITAFAFLFGMMATASSPPFALVPLALVFWCHDAASNLVGALRDIDGDREGGYRTLPVNRGVRLSMTVVTALYVAAVVIAAAAPALSGRPATAVWAATFAVAVLLGAGAVGTLYRAPRPMPRPVALRAHEILVAERVLLAGAFVSLGGGALTGLPILAAVLAVSLATQRKMRHRHEFGVPGAVPVDAGTVLRFVDKHLGTARPPAGLAGWHRRIDIELAEPGLRIPLVVEGGVPRRRGDGEHEGLPLIRITTTGTVFRDIFLHGRSNPRRAYLARQVRMDASARDMMCLNQLFNAWRSASPKPATSARAGEPVRPRENRLPDTIVLSDTTLRDGEQMPGLSFHPEQKLDIARRLAALGVPLVEAGFPAVSEEEARAVRAVVDAELDVVVQAIARPKESDIRAAADTGAQSIAVFIGTSDTHVRAKLGLTRDELLRRVHDGVARAARTGRQVVFAAEDASRTDPEFLVRVYTEAADAGADVLGLADTGGVATPWSIGELVDEVTRVCPLPLAVHCHNDLGLATANSLAGVLAGASGIQCSVLGIGERAGNAPLEEVALALEVTFGHRTGLALPALEPLARRVSGILGQETAPYKPVVGGNAFVHESGLHVDGILSDPATYEPYAPELVGRARRIVFGKHSGRAGVRQALGAHRVDLTDGELSALLERIKDRAGHRGHLDQFAVVELAKSVSGQEGVLHD